MEEKKTRKRTSEIWNHFTPVGKGVAACNLCKKQFSFKSTITNLNKHAERTHPALVNRKSLDQSQNTSAGTKQVTSPTPVKKTPSQTVAPRPVSPAPLPPPPLPPAPPQEVCLRWTSYNSNMQVTFPSLLDNEQFVDVTLACEGRSIKCHKMMLSACSCYFAELLSQNPCQHPIVLMKDLKFWEVQALVDFMYRGEVSVSQDKLQSLLAAAEALQIKGLAGPPAPLSSQVEESHPVISEDLGSTSSSTSTRQVRKRKSTQPQPPVPTSTYHQEPPVQRPRTSVCIEELKLEPEEILLGSDHEDFDVDKTYSGGGDCAETYGGGHNTGIYDDAGTGVHDDDVLECDSINPLGDDVKNFPLTEEPGTMNTAAPKPGPDIIWDS